MDWGQIVLYSNDVERLARFLERLLDAEMNREKDSIKLLHPHFTLSIQSGPNFEVEKSMAMELFVADDDGLDQLAQRAQFCLYQTPKEKDNLGALKVEQDHVLVWDPDGRVWKFSAKGEGPRA